MKDWFRLGLTVAAFACLAAASFIDVGAAQSPATPATETHYSPRENLEAIDGALIDAAGETLDMAAYVLTDWRVIDALTDAAGRGVALRLALDATALDHADPNEVAKLKASGATLRFKPPGGPWMHLKSYCVDGHTLRAGAANFSASGLKHQENDLVVIRGTSACAGFEATFEQLWEASK